MFNELQELIPNPIFIKSREGNDYRYNYFGSQLLNKGPEMSELFMKGLPYLKQISDPISRNVAIIRSDLLNKTDDYNTFVSYPQYIKLNNKMTPLFTNKLLLDDEKSIAVCYLPEDLGKVGKIFTEIAPEFYLSAEKWQSFQSLTKQEKRIVKLISKGWSNNRIGDYLYISSHTVRTHRKNINKKLRVKSLSQLIRFSLVMDLF
ncbi:response regulator transcription factor [Ulvibacterium sp.]|uniref:response regulator transcription factor n=1 Tax=Ulvibacterium sp. TaxID=2665914 RepID=UPI003BAC55D0